MNVDLKKMTYKQMANVIRSIWKEMKHRNPIGINFEEVVFRNAVLSLEGIHASEKGNPTSEHGPGSRRAQK